MKRLLQQAWLAVGIAERQSKFCLAIAIGIAVGIFEGLGLLLLAPALSLGSGRSFSPMWQSLLPKWNNGTLEIALIGSFAFLTILSGAARFAGNQISTRLRANVEFAMRKKLTARLMETNWTIYQGLRVGDLVKAIVIEGNYAGLGVESLTIALSSLVIAALLLGFTVILGGALSLLVCFFGAILAIVLKLMGRRQRLLNAEIAQVGSRVGEVIEETLTSLKFLRSTGLQDAAKTQLEKLYLSYETKIINESQYLHSSRLVLEIFGVIIVTVVMATSIFFTAIPITQVLVFLMIFYRLAPRLQAAQDGFAQARNLLAWFELWAARQDRLIARAPRVSGRSPDFEHGIQLEGVEFQYPQKTTFNVEPIDLDIPRGSCMAFVGSSGSGKTTILDLMTGLLSPTAGSILIGGVPLEAVDIAALRRHVGLVMQETPMFHASVLENICLFEEQPDEERAKACAEIAHAWEFIRTLPEGLHTVIGEKGGRLSGGQRQRLALARALYRDPSILILDEATSNLDDESEVAIIDALAKLKDTMTIILVSHRPAILRLADVVITLDSGSVKRRQTSHALIAPQSAGGQSTQQS